MELLSAADGQVVAHLPLTLAGLFWRYGLHPQTITARLSTNAGERQSVTDREQDMVDPLVGLHLLVEGAHDPGVLAAIAGLGDLAAPQDVVDQEQAAGTND